MKSVTNCLKMRQSVGRLLTALHGFACHQLGIDFKASIHARKATRAIGFFGPDEGEFTIVMVCTHKDNVYKPASALKTASSRRNLFAEGAASCAPLKIDGEEFPPIDEA